MDEVRLKYDLDLESFYAKAQKVSDTLGTIEDAVTGMRRVDPFTQANTSATAFNKNLGAQVQIYQRAEAAANSFRAEQKRLEAQHKDLKKRQNEFLAAGKYTEYKAAIGQITDKLRQMKSPLVEVDSFWDRLKAKFKTGLSAKVDVPIPNVPNVPNVPGDKPDPNTPGNADPNRGVKGAIVGGIENATGLQFDSKQALLASGVLAVGAAVFKTVQETAKFGKALSELSAITGVTGKDLEFLADQAVDLENKTGIAATDIVEGFKLVGSIKPELLESKEALAQVTDEIIALSQASGVSLQDAAASALGALNQFGEGADQAGRFVNVLAAGAKLGASEVNDTSEALKASGTAMKAAGLSFEQGNSLIQSLAGVMIKGSEAGTGLRNVLLKLETQSDKGLRPSVVGLDAALEAASKKFNTTTELTKVFGVENIVAARRILDTRTEISKMTQDLTGTSVAYDQQRTNLDNLATDLTKAGTAIGGLFREMGRSQDGFIRGTVRGFTLFLQQLTNATSVTRTFFRSLLDGEGGFLSAFRDASKQADANDLARRKTAEIGGIKSAATQGVADDTKSLTELYTKQGQTVPKAQRAAADKVKEQNDEAYKQAVADHNRLRKELEGANKDQKAAFDKQFEQSRRNILRTKTAKSVADNEVARLAAADASRATALKSALSEAPTDDAKKQGEKAKKAAEDAYKLLLSAQEEYTKEYQKLEQEFGKDKLEALKKDENAYLLEKAKLDKQQVDAERDHLEKLLQLAASNKTKVNKLTGQREVVADTTIKLPADLQAEFDLKKQNIDVEADRQIRINRIRQEYELLQLAKQGNQNELAQFDKFWEEKLAIEEKGAETYAELVRQRDSARLDYVKKGNQDDINEFDAKWAAILASEEKNAKKYAALVRKRDADRVDLTFDQIIRDQKAIESIANSRVDTRKKPGDQTGGQFAKQNELDKIANSLFANESISEALQKQGNPANAPEIARLEAYIKALKDKRKEIEMLQPATRDVWDLLGISKSFADDTERQVFLNSIQQIGDAIRQATDAAIQQSEARIQALDAQIQAKEEQIQTEEERSKEGYANNLSLRRKELEDLKRQKAEEEATRRRSLAIQQGLDLAAQVSNNAVTVSNTVTAISEMFKQYGKIPLVGVFLALGAIATIIGTIASVKAKAKAITQLRKGGRIPLDGRTHEQGGHRVEGTDIEVEKGEHVINAKSSDKYDDALSYLNEDDPKNAIKALVKQFGFGLPSIIVQQIGAPGFAQPAPGMDTSRLEKQVGDMASEIRDLKNHMKSQKQVTGLGDGRVLEREGNHETVRKIK
ncbi:phage tail tape measure protein [Spirosoma utsteinense]|uniref:phage tail tape measure protein n=1 Tax=Spirosoma utsteinense TaxID=2585773 RepID=UPI0016451ECC|nr:phage tail tape measure protein [Spirosoma utsteinense]MBC3785711.1 hypothetical protein [Spirosoma utsteinense]